MVRTIRRSYIGAFAVMAAMTLMCVLATNSAAAAENTIRISVASSGNQANGSSAVPSFSDDGRYVTFTSLSTNLVPGDTNGRNDVFVRDRTLGTTERVSVSSSGNQATGYSLDPYISSNGRYVVFRSDATNLVAGDTNGQDDVFVRDRTLGTTERVSVSSSGNQATGGSFLNPSISDDGNLVAFASDATNLVTADTNGVQDVFMHERDTRTTAQPNDCIAPSTSHTVSPLPYANGWNNTDVTVTFNAQDDEGGSGVKEIRYSATGAQSISEAVYDPQNPPIINTEGTTSISYFATDNAGNQESPAKTLTVKLDKSVPSAPVISSPANNSFDTDGTITLSGTGEANATIKVFEATASGDISKGTTPVDASGTWTKILSGVSNGSHSYKAKATDAAGNTSGFSNARAIIVDKVKPKVSTATPTGTGVARGTNATATFSERMDPTTITTSTFKLFRCSSTTSTNCATQITNVTISRSMDRLKATLNPYGTSSTLLAGRTKFKVVVTTGAKDEAGNQLDQDVSMSGNQPRVWYFTTGSS